MEITSVALVRNKCPRGKESSYARCGVVVKGAAAKGDEEVFVCLGVQVGLRKCLIVDIPKLSDITLAFWGDKEAINDEMDSIMGNNTWVLADLPPGCKPLGCKWIFKRKLKVDGTIEKFKASTIRLLIALASIYNLIIHQMDVKTAFLNGDLDEEHWEAIQRVLKFLKKTMDYRFMNTTYPSVLEGYTDASWISNTKDNSSTSSWVFLLGGGAISWASKKQTCITGSTMKSKFMAFVAASKEAKCAATLAKAYSQVYNRKSRHLGVRHSMIHELITNRVISIEFVKSQQNLADHLTKGLARDFVIKSTEGMRLKSN
ncbi:zinc finger, CCHC-type containing protein [Tanacetum coccineum]